MLILLFVFSIGGGVEGNPLDSLKIQESSFWEKLSFGIGYEGGMCYSKKNLAELSSTPGLVWPFYWLNSVNLSSSYLLGGNKKIEIGIGYGWCPLLSNREGLYLYLPNEDPSTGYAYVTTSNWDLSTTLLYLRFHINSSFFIGGCMNYCVASTEEHLNHHSSDIYTKDTTTSVQRKCKGGVIFCGLEGSSMFGTSRFKPYLKLQLGWANEYKNNSPWEWEEGLKVGLSGVFIGVNFKFGGKR